MAGMLRKVNGVMERRGDDGVWRPLSKKESALVPAASEAAAENASGLESELDSLLADRAELNVENSRLITSDSQVSSESGNADKSPNGDGSTDVAELDIGDVPGLLSDESPRSTSGSARLQKLRARAKGKGGSRVVARGKPRTVVVPQSAVVVEGPDADGSRLQRGPGRRATPIKEAPALLESRPKWVQELFEAHFRSELAYQLRHLPSGKSGKNRMKLSRADYAIGWLVMFDKAREDPGILRLK